MRMYVCVDVRVFMCVCLCVYACVPRAIEYVAGVFFPGTVRLGGGSLCVHDSHANTAARIPLVYVAVRVCAFIMWLCAYVYV